MNERTDYRYTSRSSHWVGGFLVLFALLFLIVLVQSQPASQRALMGVLFAVFLLFALRAFTSFTVTLHDSSVTAKSLYRTYSFSYEDLGDVVAVEAPVRLYTRVFVRYEMVSGRMYSLRDINESPKNRAAIDDLVAEIRRRIPTLRDQKAT